MESATRAFSGNRRVVVRFVGDLLRSARQPDVFRRCVVIALIVGTLLTAVNQFDLVTTGRVDLPLGAKIAANYVIPFAVSNLGAMRSSASSR